MINTKVSELLGIVCHHLDDAGDVAVVDTPFLFSDGDSIPVYIEQVGDKLRFFDDGELISRFMGFGYRLDEPGDTKFIEDLVEPSGVMLNDDDEFELWTDVGQVPVAFARYVSAMLAIVRWEDEEDARVNERRRQGVPDDAVNV